LGCRGWEFDALGAGLGIGNEVLDWEMSLDALVLETAGVRGIRPLASRRGLGTTVPQSRSVNSHAPGVVESNPLIFGQSGNLNLHLPAIMQTNTPALFPQNTPDPFPNP
jgi:hypothetical protein